LVITIKNTKNIDCINLVINILIIIISDNPLIIDLLNLFSDNF